MSRPRTIIGTVALVGVGIAACSTSAAVEVESRRETPPTEDSTEADAADTAPPIITGPAGDDVVADEEDGQQQPEAADPVPLDDVDPGTDDVVELIAGELTVTVSLRTTVAPAPPGGYDGFAGAVVATDGSVVAHGFDDVASGGAPERSALWHSTDAMSWKRVGREVGAPAGQQSLFGMSATDGLLTVYANELTVADTITDHGTTAFDFDGISRFESVDGGFSWDRSDVWQDAFGSLVDGADDDTVLVGASELATNRPIGSSFVELDAEPRRFQRYVADLDGSGFSDDGSVLVAGTATGDATYAVGSTTATDPDRADDITFQEQLLGRGPIDVGVWISTDGAKNWDRQRSDAFSGRSGAQFAMDIVELDGVLWMLVAVETVDGLAIGLHSSTDEGGTWSPTQLDADPGPDRLPGSILVPVLVGGHVTVLDGVILVAVNSVSDATPGVDTTFTLFDPTTEEVDTRSVTTVLAVEQIEAVLSYDDAWIGVGRRERADLEASDLQTVDIAIDRSSPAAPSGGSPDA